MSVDYCHDGSFTVSHNGATYKVEASLSSEQTGCKWLTCRIDGVQQKVKVVSIGNSLNIFARVSVLISTTDVSELVEFPKIC